MNSLIDMWPSTYLQMLKSKFQAVSNSPMGIDHHGFRKLFPKLKSFSNNNGYIRKHHYHNGRLDFKEFCLMLSLIFNADENDRLGALFYFYDYDKDKQLSKEELQFFVRENQQYLCNSDSVLKAMKVDEFRLWVDQNFNILRYFEIFELIPGPLKERERMREILSQQNQGKYYVISYKWWELWRFYINYNFAQNPKKKADLSIIDLDMQELEQIEPIGEQQGFQGSMIEEWNSDPKNPKWELKHGICDSSNHNAILLPLEEPQTLRPGPIDNSDLQGEFPGELRQNILNNHDYLILPEQAWISLVQWYGCQNNLAFKRRDFQDPKHNIKIVDMYPPLLRGYITNKKGEIIYKKHFEFMVSHRKVMGDIFRKLCKRFKVTNPLIMNLYYMKIGEDWKLAEDMGQNLLDLQINQGTFVALVPKNRIPISYYTAIGCGLGQILDVQHPLTNEWMLCHVSYFAEDFSFICFHIQRESYTREFNLPITERINRIYPPNTKNKQEQIQFLVPNISGLSNLGNTCFMNTVLQCLINTPLFDEYLIKQSFKSDLRKTKQQTYLIEELSKLAIKVQDKKGKHFGPDSFKKAIDQNVPQFSGFEQHDAQEFLNIILDNMSDEIKSYSKQFQLNNSFSNESNESVIKELFTGKTVNIIECQQCHKKSEKVEEYYTLSLPIPLNDEINMIVIFFKKCTKSQVFPLLKYGIKVSKYGTLKDLYTSIEKVTGISCSKFEVAEIYRSSIHRLFTNYDPKTTIRQIGLKANSQLYAYEIARSAKEVEDDYQELIEVTPVRTKDFQENDYVDVEDKQGDWRHGLITQVLERKGEKNYRVMVKWSCNAQQYYFFHIYQIAPYRTKVQCKLRLFLTTVLHRIYNQTTDNMDRFATPFLIIIPSYYLTWFELQVLIYNQAKRFIDFEYVKKKKLLQKQVRDSRQLYRINCESVHDDCNSIPNKQNVRSVYLGKDIQQEQKSHRKTEQDLDDFQTRHRGPSYQSFQEEINFIKEPDFPYKIRLLDSNTMYCLACEKQTNIYNKQCCQGCENDPQFLSLHANQNVVIALDWIDSLAFNPHSNMPQNDESYNQMIDEKNARKDRIVPEQCFSLLTQEEKVEIYCDQCQSKQTAITKFQLDHIPNILILHLKRFQYRDGYLEKIESDVNFPFKSFNLKQWQHNQTKDRIYDLYAVANHFGNGLYGNNYNQNILGHYTAYILKQFEGKDMWVHCDDDQVRPISQDKVLSQFAYLLFYRRREFPTSAILNLTYKN